MYAYIRAYMLYKKINLHGEAMVLHFNVYLNCKVDSSLNRISSPFVYLYRVC